MALVPTAVRAQGTCPTGGCEDAAKKAMRHLKAAELKVREGAFYRNVDDFWWDGHAIGFVGPDNCQPIQKASFEEPTWDYIQRVKPYAYTGGQVGQTAADEYIVYINGINTDHQKHCDTLKAIGEATCKPVLGILNATQGAGNDVLQTWGDKSFVRRAWSELKQGVFGPDAIDRSRNKASYSVAVLVILNALANQAREDAGLPKVQLHLMVHSQGGPTARTGLRDAKNELAAMGLTLSDLKVTTFGAAEWDWVVGPGIGDGATGGYDHYVHCWDVTPRLLGLGCTLQHNAGGYPQWDTSTFYEWWSGREERAEFDRAHGIAVPEGGYGMWQYSRKPGHGAKVTRFIGEPDDMREIKGWESRTQWLHDMRATEYHDVIDTYLRFWIQKNGVCREKAR